MAPKNLRTILVSLPEALFFWSKYPPVLLHNASPSNFCWLRLSVFVSFLKFTRNYKRILAWRRKGLLPVRVSYFCPCNLRLHEAFDVLVILLTHSSCAANSNCRSYEHTELQVTCSLFPDSPTGFLS